MRFQARDKEQWHDWFAWWPVLVGGELVWWERVQRRWNSGTNLVCIDPYDPGEYAGAWEYRNVR